MNYNKLLPRLTFTIKMMLNQLYCRKGGGDFSVYVAYKVYVLATWGFPSPQSCLDCTFC